MTLALLHARTIGAQQVWRRYGRSDIIVPGAALAARLARPLQGYNPADNLDLVGVLRKSEPGYYRSDITPTGCVWSGGSVGSGDLVVQQSGVEVTGVRVPNGRIRGNSSVTDVWVHDNYVHGGPTPGGTNQSPYPLIQSSFNGGTGWLVEDNTCIWDSGKRTVDSYGIHLRSGTARRNQVEGCVDSIVLYGDHCFAHANLLRDGQVYANDPRQIDGSHSDGIQDEGGADHEILGNDIYGPTTGTAAILLSQNHARYNKLRIMYNRIYGGKTLAVIGTEKGKGAFLDFDYSYNIHDRTSTEGVAGRSVAIFDAATFDTMTKVGNTFTDGTAMAVRRDNG